MPASRFPVSGTLRVVLADDHDLVRSGIRVLLSTLPGIEVVAEARDGEELLAVLEQEQPHVVLTDMSMPRMDGLTAIQKIRERHPRLRVVVLSMHDDIDVVRRAVAVGASGYLMKNASPGELEHALRTVVATGSYFGNGIAQMLLQPAPPEGEALTERQIEVLTLLAEGLSSKEIGNQLGLSSKTVDVHRARIMSRLELKDVASLTRYAVRKGLVRA
jgi:DNA-binding NarL/FixJ family response regulator